MVHAGSKRTIVRKISDIELFSYLMLMSIKRQKNHLDIFGQPIWKPAFLQLTSRHNTRKVFCFDACMMLSVSDMDLDSLTYFVKLSLKTNL